MKQVFLLLVCVGFSVIVSSQTPNFTITNTTGTYTLSCAIPGINLVAIDNYTSPVSYSWTGPGSPFTGSNVVISIPGSYTVSSFGNGNISSTKIVTIFSNTVVPIGIISPSMLSISCADPGGAFTMTAISPTTNISQNLYTPFGGTFTSLAALASYSPLVPGTYTYVLKDNSTGCTTFSLCTITSTPGFPTFSLTPNGSANFTISCPTNTSIGVNIQLGSTVPVPGGPVSYTLIGPSTSTFVASGPLSMNSTYYLTIPGTYTFILRDNITGCTSKVPVTIYGNVTRPANLSIGGITPTLNCINISTVLIGSSSSPSVTFAWQLPIAPGTVSGNSVQVNANFSAPSNSLLGNYTLAVTSTTNSCVSYTSFSVYQNIAPPNPIIGSGGLYALTCYNPTLMLSNASTSGISLSSGFPNSGPVTGKHWYSPLPDTLSNSPTYTANTAGIYTLVAYDTNNGCSSTTIITISDQRSTPNVKPPAQAFDLCANPQVTIYAIIPNPSPSFSYVWNSPSGAVVSGATSASLTTNSTGIYTLTVTDANGCKKTVTVSVLRCTGINTHPEQDLGFKIFPNPGNGIFTLQSTNWEKEQTLQIYNLLGQLIRKQKIISDSEVIDLQNESPGMYFFVIKEQGELSSVLRVLKQ